MRRLIAIVAIVGLTGCGPLRAQAPGDAPREGAVASDLRRDGALATVAEGPAARSSGRAEGTRLDADAIQEASGLTGALMSDGALRITRPRGDLKVALDGFAITPRMGLAGSIVFLPHPSGALLTGVLAVASDELQPVVSALVDAGLEPTAVHGHFAGEEPRILFVHFDGAGNAIALARGVRDVQEAIVRVRAARPLKTTAVEAHSELDASHLDVILGRQGELDNGVYRVAAPRSDLRVVELGVELDGTLRPASWAAFQGTPLRAAVAGELVLVPSEVPQAVHALRESRIGITGIHGESSRREPRLVVVSFWGVDRLDGLAAGVRRALDLLPRGG